jgi:hypothetical protein
MENNREELRRRLREKMRGKRNPSDIGQNVKRDPKGFLLSMGVHDENLLNVAESAIKHKNPKTLMDAWKDSEEAPPPG